MTEKQIIDETLRYINDKSYQYAILIDGEWGSGKTFFVTKKLKKEIEKLEANLEKPRSVKYISLCGCKSTSDIQENLVWEIADEARKTLTQKVGLSEKCKRDLGKKMRKRLALAIIFCLAQRR